MTLAPTVSAFVLYALFPFAQAEILDGAAEIVHADCDTQGTATRVNKISPSVRWLHLSAEYEAIVRQTYTLAYQLVRSQAKDRKRGTWAIVLDADETVISNSLYEWELQTRCLKSTPERWQAWVERQEASAVPGVVEFLEGTRALGGHIAIVTNRYLRECPDTKANLRKLDIPFDIMLCRTNERDKEPRWNALRDGTASPDLPPLEILLWIGDNINDFPRLDQELRFSDSESFSLFGSRYLVIPNPVHGSWIKNTVRKNTTD